MNLFELKVSFVIIILLMTIGAAWVPFRKRLHSLVGHEFPRGEALASGVFLGAGLIHMLGDASSQFHELNVTYPLAFLLCGISFLFLLYLEHLGGEMRAHYEQNNTAIAILAVVMLSIHSLFEGTALGLSRQLSTGLLIFIAIIAHKWAEGFALAVQLNKSTIKLSHGLLYFALFALMTPIGIILGNYVMTLASQHNYLQPIFTSFAAGTFLYIGTLHGLKRSVMVERCCNLHDFGFVIVGFSLMAIVAIWT